MSVKTEMMRAVMNVIALRKGITNIEDNDIDFIEAAGNYGASIDKANSDFGQAELKLAGERLKIDQVPTGATDPKSDPGGEIDRGPEPQTIGQTLDPAVPEPATDPVNDGSNDPEQPILLSTKKG